MIVKEESDNKITLIIAILILIALLAVLIIKLNDKKETAVSERITCTFEGGEEDTEITSTLEFKTTGEKLSFLTYETLYINTEDEQSLSIKYNEEQNTIDTIKNEEGIKASITKNPEAGSIEVYTHIDYSKVKTIDSINSPYNVFINKDLTKTELMKFLNNEAYECETS